MFSLWAAVLSFITRQAGLRTDAANAAGSLHAKVKDLRDNGTEQIKSSLNTGAAVLFPQPSNALRLSADTERSTTNTAYVCMKKIVVYRTGYYRVSFNLKSSNSGYMALGRVYRNGGAYGTECSTISTTYVIFTQDLAFSAGDSVELWIYITNSVATAYANNFRIYFDLAFVHGTITTN